jgi:hypothetical protein
MKENSIVPFGKYKGQPTEVLAKDPSYCEWFLAQGNIKRAFPEFCQIVINNFSAPSDTPEHNALQTRFLDNEFCFALGKLCNWKLMKKRNCIRNLNNAIYDTQKMPDNNDFQYNKKREKLEELKSHKEFIDETVFEVDGKEFIDHEVPYFELKQVFEQDGWDVIIQTYNPCCETDCVAYRDCDIHLNKIAIEIKPMIGDDYPAILRQMKIARVHPDYQCLVYDTFNATGATIDQVKSIFKSSGFLVFSFIEIENIKKEIVNEK